MKTKRSLFALFILALAGTVFFRFAQPAHAAYNPGDQYSIEVTKETVDNESGTFKFRIQAKHIETGEPTVTWQSIASFTQWSDRVDEFKVSQDFTYNGTSYTKGQTYYSNEGWNVFSTLSLSSTETDFTDDYGNPAYTKGIQVEIAGQTYNVYEIIADSWEIRKVVPGQTTTSYFDFSYFGTDTDVQEVPGQPGVYEFSLENGKSKTFEGIPANYEYKVWEVDESGNAVAIGGAPKDGWVLVSVNGDTSGSGTMSGTLGANEAFTFLNKGPRYKVSYVYSGELPESVTATLPSDDGAYKNGTTVEALDPSATELAVSGGKWVFQGWDTTSATIAGADVVFTGTWEFVAEEEDSGDNTTENETPESSDTSDPTETSEPTDTSEKTTTTKTTKKTTPVKPLIPSTGDSGSMLSGALVASSSLLCALAVYVRKRVFAEIN